MKLFSDRNGKIDRRRCALLVSLTLHTAVLVIFWRPAPSPMALKRQPNKEADVVFLFAVQDEWETTEAPTITGTVEPVPPKQSLRPNHNIGPNKSAELRATWPSQESPTKPATFFGVRPEGRRIVFVIDRSASMGRTGAFARARRELISCLERLPSDVQFQIITYANTPQLLFGSPHWMNAAPNAVHNAAQKLSKQIAEGGTDHIRALEKGLWLGADVLFLLTDAHDFSADDLKRANMRNQGKCVIHVILVGSNNTVDDGASWRILANRNGGVYRLVKW